MSALVFLIQAVIISLSGVMAPGPMTAATISAGTRRRHAGFFLALGHAIVEFPLMLMIILGLSSALQSQPVVIAIGLAGGLVLLILAVQTLMALNQPADQSNPPTQRHPLWTGVLMTAGNPYFLIWWATIGLALTTQAAQLGIFAFALFALVHWLCDLIWLEAVSLASFKGSKLLSPRTQRIILAICAAAMLAFGLRFLYHATKLLITKSA